MSNTAGGATHVLEQGGEVALKGREARLNPDRIEFLPSGMVKLVFKTSYEKQYHPREDIEAVYTHTKQEEEEDWW